MPLLLSNHPACCLPAGGPPPLPRDAPPLPGEPPEAKRQRTDQFVLQAEEEFADECPGPQKVRRRSGRGWGRDWGRAAACGLLLGAGASIKLFTLLPPPADTLPLPPAPTLPILLQVHVLCPTVEGSDTLKGQLLAVEMPSLLASVADLKARLSEVLSLPPGKQQLSREHVGVLKNELTLAFYNVDVGVQLQLGLKERGGRKK